MLSPVSSGVKLSSSSGCNDLPTCTGRYAASLGIWYGLCVATAMHISSIGISMCPFRLLDYHGDSITFCPFIRDQCPTAQRMYEGKYAK